jgi:hypothetical protein
VERRRFTGRPVCSATSPICGAEALDAEAAWGLERLVTLPSEEWLPLLRRLTEVSSSWGVWKNADRALTGSGDIDSVAPAVEHGELARVFTSWAVQRGYRWVVRCSHAGGILVLIAVQDSKWAQLDLVFETPFRGARLFSAEQLPPLMIMDPRGFRRVRDGAEGLFLFLYKGTRRGGRPDWADMEKYRILEKMQRDWEGAEAAGRLLGRAGAPVLSAARHALTGRWETTPMLQAEALVLMRALVHPRALAARVIKRSWTLPRCAVSQAIDAGRQPESLQGWLRDVASDHAVEEIRPDDARRSSL